MADGEKGRLSPSVRPQTGIYLLSIGINPPRHVLHVPKTLGQEKLRHTLAPVSRPAKDQDLAFPGEFREALRNLIHRHVKGPRKTGDRQLFRLSHIQKDKIVSASLFFCQFPHANLHNAFYNLPRARANFIIILELPDASLLPTKSTARVTGKNVFFEIHFQRVHTKQAPYQGFADSRNEFEDLHRLKGTHYSRKDAQHPRLRTARNFSRGGRFGIKAPVAWTLLGKEHAHPSFKPENASMDVRLPEEKAGIVHQITRGEIIGPIHYHVIRAQNLKSIFPGQTHRVDFQLNVRIESGELLPSRLHLRLPHIRIKMQNLSVQIGAVHDVKIHQADPSHACRGKIISTG
jgi:hypothetical protein